MVSNERPYESLSNVENNNLRSHIHRNLFYAMKQKHRKHYISDWILSYGKLTQAKYLVRNQLYSKAQYGASCKLQMQNKYSIDSEHQTYKQF